MNHAKGQRDCDKADDLDQDDIESHLRGDCDDIDATERAPTASKAPGLSEGGQRNASQTSFSLQTTEQVMQAWFPPSVPLADRHPYSETDLRQMSNTLRISGRESWSRVPRLYATLRVINQLHLIDDFIVQGLNDVWFPFSNKTLEETVRSSTTRKDFIEAQRVVLSKALYLEKEDGTHRHFSRAEDIPLIKVGKLGTGNYGVVDRVVSTITRKEYARKLLKRGLTFRTNKEVLRDFELELATLKKLSHWHIVELVGSYTDPKYVGILMSPIADCDLEVYLKRPISAENRSLLQTSFGCLAAAVAYLHENRIRHKDIKPKNILVKVDQILVTDFGISRDWTDLGASTTTGPTAKTPKYCSPEVANAKPRNTSADIWSLGCVFLEVWSVLCGESLESLNAYMSTNGSQSTCYHNNLPIVDAWIAALETKVANVDLARPTSWISMMLKIERHDRCSGQSLFDIIHESSRDPSARLTFVGLCCTEEEDSDESVQSSTFDPEARERATETTMVSSITSHVVPETPRGVAEAPPAMEDLTLSAEEILPPAVPTSHRDDSPGDGIVQRIYIASKSVEQPALKKFSDNTAYPSEPGVSKESQDITAVKAELYPDQETHLPAFRWWYTNSGRHKAVFAGWYGHDVLLRGTNGELTHTQFAELSIGDKEYLKTRTESFTIPTEPAVHVYRPIDNDHTPSKPTEPQDQRKQQVSLLDAEPIENSYRTSNVQEIDRPPPLTENYIPVSSMPIISRWYQHLSSQVVSTPPDTPKTLPKISRWSKHSSLQVAPIPAEIPTTLPKISRWSEPSSSQIASIPADILTTLPITPKDYFIPHYITSVARSEYDDLFYLGTLGSSNTMTGSRFKQLLEGCGVSNDDLERIWRIVDEKDVGLLNLNGFAVAVHLIYRRLNSHPVPTLLEPDMQNVLDGQVWCNRAGNKEPPKYSTAESFNLTPITRPPLPPRNSTITPTTPLVPVAETPTPRSHTPTPAAPLSPIDVTPTPAPTHPADQPADQRIVSTVEKRKKEHTEDITPETMIEVRVTTNDQTTKFQIKYAHLTFTDLEQHLSTVMHWPYKHMNMRLDRWSKNRAAYVRLPAKHETDDRRWKEVKSAARAGRKLNLRVTLNPAPPSSAPSSPVLEAVPGPNING